MSKKQKPIGRLMGAVDGFAALTAEAMWTQGYRAHREAHVSADDGEASRLQSKEVWQWKAAHRAQARVRRVALRLLREAAR